MEAHFKQMKLVNQTKSILESIASNLSEQTRQNISTDGISLVFPEDATEGELKHIVSRLGAMQGSTEKLDSMLRYFIGRTVLTIVASCPIKRTLEEVVDEMNLAEIVGRSSSTIMNWCYVARTIPPEELRAVSWTVLSEAAARIPSEPDKALEWRKQRQELLADAEQHPEDYTAKKVREKVKEMQTQLSPSTGSERSVRDSTQELLMRHVKLSRLRHVAVTSELREIGIDSHGALTDMTEAIVNELINRDEVEPDPLAENFYWIKKPQETEEV